MLLATLVPKLIGFRACIPNSQSATISSSSSSASGSTSSLNEGKYSPRPLTMDEALQLTDKSLYKHAAHCLLYCKTVDNDVECIFGLCQVRFDGQLGFPGGIVGDKEELNDDCGIIKGLERELKEEIDYSSKPSDSLTDDTNGFIHISTYIRDQSDPNFKHYPYQGIIYHFFAKQISEQEFKQCESTQSQSIHFPLESLGLFRIPLIDPSKCSDRSIFRYYKKRGSFLANFFKHNFAGVGKKQLFDCLVHLDCLTPDYLATLDEIVLKG